MQMDCNVSSLVLPTVTCSALASKGDEHTLTAVMQNRLPMSIRDEFDCLILLFSLRKHMSAKRYSIFRGSIYLRADERRLIRVRG